MGEFEKYYKDLGAFELVEVIESLKDYKPEVIQHCKERLKQMDIEQETLKTYAIEVVKKRFYEYFSKGKYITNSPIYLDSFLLTQKEVRACFNHSRGEYLMYIDGATRDLPS